MASSEVRAGKAYVEIEAKDKYSVQLDKMQAKLAKVGENISSFGAKLAAVGGASVVAFVPAIKAASDLQEAMGKVDVVFGDNAKSIKKWADSTSSELGRSKKKLIDYASTAQVSLSNQLGDPAAAQEISQSLARLAIDIGSLQNASDDDAFAALMSAFRGEADPIEKFGVNVKESAVALELLNQGLDKDKATEAQKAMARYAIILRETASSQGDAVRTGGGFANSLKRLQDQASDTAAELGTAVLPIATKFLNAVTENIVKVSAWAEANKPLISQYGEMALKIGAAAIAAGLLLVAVGKVITIASAAISVFNALSAISATTFVAAAPLALIAGLAAYVAAMHVATHATAQLSSTLGDNLTKGNEQRGVVKGQVDRLKELAARTSLTNDEQKESAKIIEALTERYGNLGLSIDKATGRLSGYTAASAKIREDEKKNKAIQLRAAVNEKKGNIQALNDERDSLNSQGNFNIDFGTEDGGWIEAVSNQVRFILNGGEAKAHELERMVQKEQKELAELRREQAKLNDGDDPLVSGNPAKSSALKAKQDREQLLTLKASYKDTASKLGELQEAQRRELFTDTEQKVPGVNEKLKDQIKLVDELAKNATAQKDVTLVAQVQQQRVDIVRNAEEQIRRIREAAAKEQLEKDRKDADEIVALADRRAGLLRDAAEAATGRGDKGAAAGFSAAGDAVERDGNARGNAGNGKLDAGEIRRIRGELAATVAALDAATVKSAVSGDLKAYQDAQRARVDAVTKAEADVQQIRTDAYYRQLEQTNKLADTERARRDKALQEQKDADERAFDTRQLFLEQLRALADKQGKNGVAKEYDKLIKAGELEKKLTALFGTDEKAKALARKLQGQVDTTAEQEQKSSAQGLFNIAGLQSLQGTRTADRLVTAAEQTQKNTKDLRDFTKDNAGGLKFK